MDKLVKALLIEDNPDDAEMIRILSADISAGTLDITSADTLSEGMILLSRNKYDIVLMDLFLPDSMGIDTLAHFSGAAVELPMIVMSGHNNEELASLAVQQGAQDYLIKGKVDSNLLWRAVNYAIERKRMQAQLEEMRMRERRNKEIESLRTISNSSTTEVTARFLGITSLRKFAPDIYKSLSEEYGKQLDHAIEKRIYKVEYNISEGLRKMSEQLGFLKAGPRDVIEIHTGVLEEKCHGAMQSKAQAYIEEGRILLLELMGDIVMFYRNNYVENRGVLFQEGNRVDTSGRKRKVKNNGE